MVRDEMLNDSGKVLPGLNHEIDLEFWKLKTGAGKKIKNQISKIKMTKQNLKIATKGEK